MSILNGKKRGLFKFWTTWTWLKHEGAVLWRAMLDPATPMRARIAALAVIAYVVSPIDLIPDFIPVVGWLDDLIVIPLGFALVRMMVPDEVWTRAGGDKIERRGRTRGGMKNVTPVT